MDPRIDPRIDPRTEPRIEEASSAVGKDIGACWSVDCAGLVLEPASSDGLSDATSSLAEFSNAVASAAALMMFNASVG